MWPGKILLIVGNSLRSEDSRTSSRIAHEVLKLALWQAPNCL